MTFRINKSILTVVKSEFQARHRMSYQGDQLIHPKATSHQEVSLQEELEQFQRQKEKAGYADSFKISEVLEDPKIKNARLIAVFKEKCQTLEDAIENDAKNEDMDAADVIIGDEQSDG